jgi:hypothetical protein
MNFLPPSPACFFRNLRPEGKIFEAFKRIELHPLSQVFFVRYAGDAPYRSIERLLERAIGSYKFKRMGIREMFEELDPYCASIPLVEITGCLFSKSCYSDFELIASSLCGSLVSLNSDEADYYAAQVFEGDYAREGELATVYRQSWDESNWFSNAGGSHRATAVWKHDKANQVRRMIDCQVREVKITDQFLKLAETYDIYLFEIKDHGPLLSFMEVLSKSSSKSRNSDLEPVELFELSFGFEPVPSTLADTTAYALFVEKTFSYSSEMVELFEARKIFNFSNWVRAPSQFRWDENYCILV